MAGSARCMITVGRDQSDEVVRTELFMRGSSFVSHTALNYPDPRSGTHFSQRSPFWVAPCAEPKRAVRARNYAATGTVRALASAASHLAALARSARREDSALGVSRRVPPPRMMSGRGRWPHPVTEFSRMIGWSASQRPTCAHPARVGGPAPATPCPVVRQPFTGVVRWD